MVGHHVSVYTIEGADRSVKPPAGEKQDHGPAGNIPEARITDYMDKGSNME